MKKNKAGEAIKNDGIGHKKWCDYFIQDYQASIMYRSDIYIEL